MGLAITPVSELLRLPFVLGMAGAALAAYVAAFAATSRSGAVGAGF